MDVTGWTVDQRMRLPDWCFGNRSLIGLRLTTTTPGGYDWDIAALALPDPCCIWGLGLNITQSDQRSSFVRMGLATAVPTSSAEMDATTPLFPYFGNAVYTPPRVHFPTIGGPAYFIPVRKGMVTGGKKFVGEIYLHGAGTALLLDVYLIVSGLPTHMAGWLAHHKV